MAIAMSKPTANGIEPSPACAHRAARSALANRFQVSHRQAASSSQIPHLRSTLRTKVNGPLTASSVARAPKNRVQSKGLDHRLPSLKARAPSRLAASRITMISKEPQPISCSRFNTAGSAAPCLPRLSLSAAMDDKPVSLPITPTEANSSTPTAVPRKIASNDPDKPRPGASSAPVCSTIRPMPRENQRENRSRAPKTRWASGTAESGE
ncbi:hypothetical protein D3C85_1008910 [compost metagenome]